MNKVHHIVWNKTLSVWQAASENTKSNTKNGKAFRLNTLTSVLALSFLDWFFPQIANATCDIPAIPASNSTVTCTGTTSGTYTISYAQNVQLTNQGEWTLSGASLGLVNADFGDLTGLVVSNAGTMTWDNAQYGGPGTTGSRAVINAFTNGNTARKVTGINDSTGIINLNVISTPGVNKNLFGMALTALGADSSTHWINHGQINVNSSADYQSGSLVGAGVARGITQIEAVNTGDIRTTQLSGTSSISGLSVYLRGGSTVPSSAMVTNSGNIRVIGPNAQSAYGLIIEQTAENVNGNASVLRLNNTGTIQLDTKPANGIVVNLVSRPVSNVSFEIENSGSLLAKDSSGAALVLSGSATSQTAPVKLDNTGTIVGQIFTRSGNDQVYQKAGSISGNVNLGGGNDMFLASGGSLVGSTYMGDGDDELTLTETIDVNAAPQFDGGLANDALNISGINMKGFTAASNDSTGNDLSQGNNLTQWETINLNNAAKLTLAGDLFTGANVGTLNINSASTLDLTQTTPTAFSVYGDVNNGGIVDMFNNSIGTMTTITGNYAGVAGSTLKMDTVLGNDASATDKLIINGNTTGTTSLSVNNVGGTGAQTVEGIQVVQVDGASSGTFALTSPVQAGSYEYQLFQGGTSTPTDGDWYLRSHLTTVDCKVTNTCTPIYRPGVAGYVAAQTANAHQGFDQLGTLHERMGEQRHVTADGKQTWGRIYHREESNDGHDRFSYDQNRTGFQIGQDLWVKRDNQAQKHAGVSLSYVHSNADFSDSVRPLAGLEAGTGSMSADSIGIGGYYTHMGDDGRYLDVVGQISHLRNKFTDSYAGKATQTGWRAGLSAEVGKPVAEYKGWKFEPQAQLSYQYTDYGSFNDAISKVDGYDAHTLRGRVGLRVHKDANYGTDRQAQYYAIGNVIHDFIKPEAVTIGNTTVRENFDRTYWELGAGIQGQVAKNTYVYADARYQQSFQNNQHAGKVNIGIKTKF